MTKIVDKVKQYHRDAVIYATIKASAFTDDAEQAAVIGAVAVNAAIVVVGLVVLGIVVS